jgi:mono/diheme cytochrome c family protein
MSPFRIACSLLLASSALAASDPNATDAPTWASDIAPILYQSCVECHRPQQVAPFSLLEYSDAAKRADFIARVTETRYMPPWAPSAPLETFHGERRLTDAEIKTIARWAQAGAPAGDLATAPGKPVFSDRKWTLGPPDLIVRMPRPYTIPAQAEDIYRVFPMPFSLESVDPQVLARARVETPGGPETDYLAVAAIEVIAGNRRVLHHADVWIDTSGEARRREAAGGEVGFTSFGTPGFPPAAYLGGRLPGFVPRFLPKGIAAAMMPMQGADLALQIHYSPTGKPEVDQSEVGIYFMRQETHRVIESVSLRSFNLDIPAGASNYRVEDTLTIPADSFLLNIFPHMHLLGKSVQATATFPDGTVQTLIEVDQWRFNWQNFYTYREAILLPQGTRIHCVWTFDNSEDNLSNPHDPPQRVQFGPESGDEMCELHLALVPVNLSEWGALIKAREDKMQEKFNELSPGQKARFDWSSLRGN